MVISFFISAGFILDNNASLNYRQSNTSYKAGNIIYTSSLKNGYYLKCYSEGTTSNDDINIQTNTINTLIQDGTVIWKICHFDRIFNNYQTVVSDCNTILYPGIYQIVSNTLNKPNAITYGWLMVFDYNTDTYLGYNTISQIAISAVNSNLYFRHNFHGNTSDFPNWHHVATDEQSIISSLFNPFSSGYCSFGNGLLIQWFRTADTHDNINDQKLWDFYALAPLTYKNNNLISVSAIRQLEQGITNGTSIYTMISTDKIYLVENVINNNVNGRTFVMSMGW